MHRVIHTVLMKLSERDYNSNQASTEASMIMMAQSARVFPLRKNNREANTIGSKCQSSDVAHTVVDLKSEIEKIREQIQNIE